ncbi:MAG TPA: hypothetical protein VIH93_12415 [Thermoanaerobaculia bacterium]|jgi:hypothetical protein
MKTITRTLGRNGWTLRSLALVLLLAAGAGAALTALPGSATAGPFPPPCMKYFSTITYYSDPAKTIVVGHCYTDGCDGLSQVCTGTKTSYFKFSATRCSCNN